MRNIRLPVAFCLILLAAPLRLAAQPMGAPMDHAPGGPGGPAFLGNVFPPGLIMRHQTEIGLTDTQREAITKEMAEAQKEIVGLQWDVERESGKLAKILEAERVDESAALGQAEHVMSTEQQLKKAHLKLLIRIKNALTAAQQEKLRLYRSERRKGAPRAG